MIKELLQIFLMIYIIGHPEAGEVLQQKAPVKAWIVVNDSFREVLVSDPMVDMVNIERLRAGREPLRPNARLTESATRKACDLRDRGYWAHIAPDGTRPWKFFLDAGYVYRYAGENLCRDQGTEQCMRSFMDSPGHKENVLWDRYVDLGIGRCGVFIVQHFGRRAE